MHGATHTVSQNAFPILICLLGDYGTDFIAH